MKRIVSYLISIILLISNVSMAWPKNEALEPIHGGLIPTGILIMVVYFYLKSTETNK